MRPLSAGLFLGGLSFREHLNLPSPSKEPNAAAVSRGYGSLRLALNSSQPMEPLPDVPENIWKTPALIRGLRDAFQSKEVKWP